MTGFGISKNLSNMTKHANEAERKMEAMRLRKKKSEEQIAEIEQRRYFTTKERET